jgi:alkane 1-monooxygenase
MSTMELTAPTTGWVDGKRWWWLLSPAVPAIGVATVVAVMLGAPGALLWALPFLFYVAAPLLDLLIGEDAVNAPESAVPQLDADRYYLRIVYAYLPFQYLMTVLGVVLAVTGDLSVIELIALVMATGIANGVGINTAHELGHKTSGFERWLAKITLAPVAYGHFFIEHNKGHHKNVATPEDPASSKMGETFWAFLPRSVIGSVKSAWHIEAERLQRLNKPVFSRDNENLQAWAMTVVLFAALTLWLGPWALLFLVAQAVFGFCLLEVVNYLEHYGLKREKLPSGRYERCQPRHSWNSNHVVTNLLLYQLQRHSDHHANPTRHYQSLRHFDDSPQLPSGYCAMILAAYFPPLWFRLMDAKVVAHHGGDLGKANLYPARREALLAKWAPEPGAGVSMHRAAHGTRPERGVVEAAAVEATRHQCPNCSYVYDDAVGCAREGFAPGTRWVSLPMNWQCPDCAVREKPDFVAVA